ncbi:MAG TPA: hypothetical protein VEX86_09760 [Longimicrobium sp.]|nr:hypothetical protein [Longimicrobium sp.]
MLLVIAGAVVAGLAFKAAQMAELNHTALVFVGVPALLAVVVTLLPRPGSVTGVIMKSTTLAMLLAGTVFGEAFICILMASPLIYGIALAVGRTIERKHARMDRRGAAHASLLVLVAVSVPAMEGVVPRAEFPRESTVRVSSVVSATPDEVRRALEGPMRFDRPLPRFLRLGFPTPGATEGSGLRVGDRRAVELRHGHHHTGKLVMEVRSVEANRVVFRPVSDDSYVTHWLTWREADVRWAAVPGGTRVSWTLSYRRRLDPAWYFGPLERFGVATAARYLTETLTTPASRSVVP